MSVSIPDQLRQRFSQLGGVLGADFSKNSPSGAVFSLGSPIDATLPQRGLPYGAVTEVQSLGACGVGTSLALHACQAIQTEEVTRSRTERWCAYLDPSATLFAPGASQLGVALQRLLVVRPQSEEALARTAVHIAKAGLIALLVVDTRAGLNQSEPQKPAVFNPRLFNQRLWVQTVRRLSLAVQGKKTCVLLLTESLSQLHSPLPVALRLELEMLSPKSLSIRVAKQQSGQRTAAKTIAWRAA